MKFILAPMICIAACFALSCKKASNPEVVNPDNAVLTNINNDLLLKLVNDTRAAGCNCGTTVMPPVATLSWNNILASAAISHSKDMANKNALTHDSSDGKNTGERLTAFGYKWVAYSENIAQGQTTEQQVFNDWIKSEGHCKNIMSALVTEMGAARQGTYWTQDFGKHY
ncbi:CAP domain-containing protein [Pedobacter punctiformis]|uniref:CAP domain-containing protein n=1 Tax=Pedobacter punctiformis TaxID=3004097 RepID=A0ABT4LCP6_9SPHI|nr:CAP domain-containing protein [Pedobacter sp. HCMS5-2]MCZ4245701.1 CAP domain-containing protein [Pedobacter sp. HCMS5-2]